MLLKHDMKDWQIARLMFGKNTKEECNIVKRLRTHGEITNEVVDDYWINIVDKREKDSCGWLIPKECLNGVEANLVEACA